MNIKNFSKLGCLVLAGIILAAAQPTMADGFFESFQATNALTGSTTASLTTYGTNIISWPTNSPGTNGIGVLTGNKIAVYNQDRVGFKMQGWLTNAAVTTVTVSLLSSGVTDNPQVTTNSIGNTNNIYNGPAGSFGRNDWAQNPYNITITVPALTNWWSYETNLATTVWPCDANFIGIYQITNNFAAGAYITNKDNSIFGLVKKVRPIKLN